MYVAFSEYIRLGWIKGCKYKTLFNGTDWGGKNPWVQLQPSRIVTHTRSIHTLLKMYVLTIE